MASPMHLIKQTTYMLMLYTKHMKYLLLILQIFIAGSLAAGQFTEQFQTEPVVNNALANRITEYYSEDINLPLKKQKAELLKINKQLDTVENKFSDNAVYWFIRGMQHRNMASYFIASKNSALSLSHIKNKDSAYAKAISLSEAKGKELSAAIYSTMKHGLPQDLKITATQNEISQGGNGDNDSYYWYLHWSNINQLQKAGRKKEAEDAYRTMQKELKDSGMDMSVYSNLTKQIEIQTLQKKQTTPPNKAAKKQPAQTKKKPAEHKKKEKKLDTKYIIISSIAAFSVISLSIVIVIELRRKRKK